MMLDRNEVVLARMMKSNEFDHADIAFEPNLRLLICKMHGFGIPPTPQGITRHLRGAGHAYKGQRLKETISAIARLEIRPLAELKHTHPSPAIQPVFPPIRHLRVLQGWSCGLCGGGFLSTSAELIQRHVATTHMIDHGNTTNWEACELQTLFFETKHRRYFRVVSAPHSKFGEDSQSSQVLRDGDWYACSEVIATRTTRAFRLREHLTGVRPFPTIYHPFTYFAQEHVPWLSQADIDWLFKNETFKTSSEPLFDPSHIDAERGMQAVIPKCHEDALFYNTLLYSMIKLSSCPNADAKAHCLENNAVRLLYQRLVEPLDSHITATIGSIVILKATAYKLDDSQLHKIHAHGLNAILNHPVDDAIPQNLEKALFWQDLYGALLVDCGPHMKRTGIFDDVSWLRLTNPGLSLELLPVGFRRQTSLPQALQDCVIDILELQTVSATLSNKPSATRCHQLDSMQACIETRLITQANASGSCYALVNAVRLSVLLCCYCTWMEIWNSKLILSKIVQKSLTFLELDLKNRIANLASQNDFDIVLWVILVSCSTVQLLEGQVEDLQTRFISVLGKAKVVAGKVPSERARYGLQHALQSFIYCDGWLSRRSSNPGWHDLEFFIRHRGS